MFVSPKALVPHVVQCGLRRPRRRAGPTSSKEIQLHAISVWTVADIITALPNDVDAYECRDIFGPGLVSERLSVPAWSGSHGERSARSSFARSSAATATSRSAR